MRERPSRPRVLYVQYTNPAAYPPIEHGARILADAGFDVLLIGTSRAHDAIRMTPHERIRVALMRFEPAGWRQKVHYLRFLAWSVATAARWRPTWIYASDPLSCPIALAIAAVTGARVIYHEHDSPAVDDTSVTARSTFLRAVMRARRTLASRSALCILPNDARAAMFGRACGRTDVLTVWNCPMSDEVTAARPRPAEAGLLRILYHGSIVPSRLPPTVIEAVASLPDTVCLEVVGYETVGHRGYVDSLKVLAAQLGVLHRVTFRGAVPERADLMRICATCDVGLSLQPRDADDLNQRMMVGASNKPFDYLACGLALLVSDLPDWRAMFVEGGFARSCQPESAASIQAALRWFLDHPAERVHMGEHGRRQILSAWNYERLFAPVLSLMQTGAVDGRSEAAGVTSPARG